MPRQPGERRSWQVQEPQGSAVAAERQLACLWGGGATTPRSTPACRCEGREECNMSIIG